MLSPQGRAVPSQLLAALRDQDNFVLESLDVFVCRPQFVLHVPLSTNQREHITCGCPHNIERRRKLLQSAEAIGASEERMSSSPGAQEQSSKLSAVESGGS